MTSTDRAVLRKIPKSGLNLVLWTRSLPAPVTALLLSLIAPRKSVAMDITAAPGDPLLAVLSRHAFFRSGTWADGRHWLMQDFAALAQDVAKILDCGKVRLRFNRVADVACPAFHVDSLPARLLCTYTGAGTQWADERHVCPNELGLKGRTPAEANAAIVPDPACIRTMPTGAVALFKGRLWPGGKTMGLVHRSHPGCCDRHARLLLVIDPAGHAY